MKAIEKTTISLDISRKLMIIIRSVFYASNV